MQFDRAAWWNEVSTVRDSGWVVGFTLFLQRKNRPTRYREVVLTSCHLAALTKPHQYQNGKVA
jgi:hypothetical protein